MKLRMRHAGSFAVTLLTVASAFWVAAPAIAAGFSPDQTTTGVGSPVARTNALTLEERADIFMARKNYADAVDYYYRSLKESSFKNPVVWNKMGIAYQVQNKFHSAQKAYSNATHVNHDFAEAWNNIGTLYFMEKKYAKSVKYYQRAIALGGQNASFHMNLGTSYYHLKKFDEAVQEYRTALGIDPKVMTQLSSTGTVIHASGADVEFYYYLAKAYASIGDADEAVRYLRRALEDGFKDQKRIDEDPDFKKISQHPAFVELMRNPPVAIKE
ncbi:MAG: tetratricopeptide repeat protein [Terriglobia bacterium]